ncbi:Venom allergen 3 [Anthophora plagiata]
MKGITILCITIVSAFFATSDAFNCNNNRCTAKGAVHTLCKYPNPNPAGACGKVIATGFTNAEKNEMVKSHNDLRSRVANGLEKRGNPGPQPPAKNMQHIVWDDAIANVAQRWANQCSFGHDTCRDDDRFYTGQNAAMTMTTGTVNTKPADIANMWYNEVEKMSKYQVSRLTNINDVGHYTQLVWAKTNRIGCGKIVYQMDQWKRYYVVCNYGPGGNFMGEPIYQT